MSFKRFLPVIILGAALLISAVLVGDVFAQRPVPQKLAELDYPIQELGGCTDPENCAEYCDKKENLEECVDFARKNRLMAGEGLERAEKFVAAGGKGPGGCSSQESCEAYCGAISHIDECVDFGERNGMLAGEKLGEAKKIQAALKRGVKLPDGCTTQDACERRCKGGMPGLLPEQRAIQIKACITFAKEADIVPPGEREEVEKVLAAIEKGVVPPPCGGKDTCGEYCSEEEHVEECIGFAEAAGLIDPKQAKMARLTGGKGPGGCKGEACKGFCENENNQETCATFMNKLLDEHPEIDVADFIPPEDLERMREGAEQMQKALVQAPDEVKACINEAIPGLVEKIESGIEPRDIMKIGRRMEGPLRECMPKPEFPPKVRECMAAAGVDPGFREGPPTPEQENVIKECFMEFGGPGGPPGGFQGPGGCTDEKECKAYCSEHPDECQGFGPPGEGGPGFGPPGEGFEEGEFGPPGEGVGPSEGTPGIRMGPGRAGGGPQIPQEAKKCMDQLGIGMDRQPSTEQRTQIEECVRGQMQRGGFPGESDVRREGIRPREGFRPGEENIMRPPEGFRPGEEMMGSPEGFRPPEGTMPVERFQPPEGLQPSGGFMPPQGISPNVAPPPVQYRQQYEQQYQQQYQEQRQQQYQQYPSGGTPPPTEPPPREPAPNPGPGGFRQPRNLTGFVLYLLEGLFGR